MKKTIYICILLVSVCFAFVGGMLLDGSNIFNADDDKNTETINETGKITKKQIGVYQTDYWNGKPEILALYEDGSCQYPTGANATWTADDNIVYIEIIDDNNFDRSIVEGLVYYIPFGVTEGMEDEITNAITAIEKIDNIKSVIWNKKENTVTIMLTEPENVQNTYRIMDEVSNIYYFSLSDYIYGKGVTISKHQAKIMKNGVVLHGTFFEKVSD